MLCPLKASSFLESPMMCLSKKKPPRGCIINPEYAQKQEKIATFGLETTMPWIKW